LQAGTDFDHCTHEFLVDVIDRSPIPTNAAYTIWFFQSVSDTLLLVLMQSSFGLSVVSGMSSIDVTSVLPRDIDDTFSVCMTSISFSGLRLFSYNLKIISVNSSCRSYSKASISSDGW